MPLELVDTHCHLDQPPLGQVVGAVLARARAAGVRQCVSIGTTLESSRATIVLARAHPMLRAAVGVHPHDAAEVTATTLAAIDELAGDPTVVAIGEVGLDYYRNLAPREAQHHALRGFLAVAQRRALPVLIHCREAYEDLLAVVREVLTPPVRGVIHCASGPPSFIEQAMAVGFSISFAGNVTFPNAHALRTLVGLVPDDRLLIETDAPFLAPQPVRGQTNEPAHVAHTATFLARLRGVAVEALAAQTSRNARVLFQLPVVDTFGG